MTVNTYTPNSGKPVVIYHSNCADGFSAAWCFWNKFGNEVEFYPGVYQTPPPDVKGRSVYLVDFSYKSSVLDKMLDTASYITIIDHHKSAIDDLTDYAAGLALGVPTKYEKLELYLGLDSSGATLAWEYLNPSAQFLGIQRPVLLGHIEDRDLWKFKLPLTREIQANVFSYEYTFENWDKLMDMREAELMTFSAAGAAIERKHHKDIKELVSVCSRFLRIGGYFVPAASLPYTFTSDAGHLMASQWKDGTEFAACYWDTSEARIFSLRSCDNGMDVSEIAKLYGGGGHKHAAGFKVPRNHELATA